MGETSKKDLTGDDFLSNYDFMHFPRSSSEDSMTRLDNLSSHGRTEERFTKNRKQVQQSVSAGPPSMVYTTAEASASYNSGMSKKDIDVDFQNSSAVTAVEGTMKKYADNLLRVLEGMNGRLSQLESSVFTLNHSTGDLKVSVANSYGQFDASLRSLSNHFTDVQRAMQLLRDKQEIFETHAELVKLQLAKNDSVEDSSSGSFVAEAQVSSSCTSSVHAQNLSPQHGPLTLATSQQPQSLQSSQAISPMFQQSLAVPQTETFMQSNTRPSLPSSFSLLQQHLSFTGNADMQQSQPFQGLHLSTQHFLPMQTVNQTQLQQPPFLPQQPLAEPAQFHQLQQLPQLRQVLVSQSMQLPLQHDQSIKKPLQPSLPTHSMNSQLPKTHLPAQGGCFAESQLQQSEFHLPSQGAFEQNGLHFEAQTFISHSQNLPMPAINGASQVAAQPASVLPQQQHSQVRPQIYDYYHRVGPSSSEHPCMNPGHDLQAGRYCG